MWHNTYMKEYKNRILDQVLCEKLESAGAVLIEGPKWCGKTTTAEQIAKSVFYMSEPKKRDQNVLYAQIQPEKILDGSNPRLIDEWQIAPMLWDAIRFDVDHADELGKYILTGSAVPPDTSEMEHSGTGRFAWLRMRPMTLWESGESTGTVSLASSRIRRHGVRICGPRLRSGLRTHGISSIRRLPLRRWGSGPRILSMI